VIWAAPLLIIIALGAIPWIDAPMSWTRTAHQPH
jgi:hypothetical protein